MIGKLLSLQVEPSWRGSREREKERDRERESEREREGGRERENQVHNMYNLDVRGRYMYMV